MPAPSSPLANQKGGVGKTTTTVNLAACLADAGEQVLVVDLDPQANATSGPRRAGERHVELRPARRRAARVAGEADAVREPPSRAFRPELAGAAVELSQREDGERFLAQALNGRTSRFSFVFVDCPPSLGPLTVNALAAADAVLVPVQAEYYALEEPRAASRLGRARAPTPQPAPPVAGVLLTMVDRRTRLAGEVEADGDTWAGSCSGRPSLDPCGWPRLRATACR